MSNDDDLEFECESCGKMFSGVLFAIDREFERVVFAEGKLPEVSVSGSENIANFCSADCRNKGREAVMRAEGVPIQPVGLGPIETCAKCGGPVDMTEWHLTYLDSDTRFERDYAQPLDVDYLAVVCNRHR